MTISILMPNIMAEKIFLITKLGPFISNLAERFPDLPLIIVQGAVCRPQWLVEVEGIAIAENDDMAMPRF